MRFSSRPLVSRANSSSQSLPQRHLDDVPAGAAENAFQFLNDAAVAAHRPVQPLQVAVDDEDQIVELFARSDSASAPSDSGSSISPSPRNAQTLRSVCGMMLAVLQIAHKARLIDAS